MVTSMLSRLVKAPTIREEWLSKALELIAMPLLGLTIFLVMWSVAASRIDTSLGKFPGP